jgi:hypothetical protein
VLDAPPADDTPKVSQILPKFRDDGGEEGEKDETTGEARGRTKILEDGRAPEVVDTRSTPNSLTTHAVRQLFRDFDANLAVAKLLGLPPLGETFLCVRHAEQTPSMSLYRDRRSGAWKLHDWHLEGSGDPREFLSLADLFAWRQTGQDLRLQGKPTLTAWWLRALIAAKFLEPADVPRRAMPADVRPAMRTLYEGFLALLAGKWLYDAGKPSAFTVRFAMHWCGLSSHTVQECLYHLVRQGYLRPVTRYKGMVLYLPSMDAKGG